MTSGRHDTQGGEQTAAWVGPVAITIADVLHREMVLRQGEFASRLPVRRTPQGRNVIRWIVQLMATEYLIGAEAAERGLEPVAGRRPPALDVSSALELGGVLATVLASMPAAPAVRDAVTADVTVAPQAVRAYYENNLDQFQLPESRVIDTDMTGRGPARTDVLRGELPASWEPSVFRAAPGTAVRVTGDCVITVREIRPGSRVPFETVAGQIAADLANRARDLHFADWVHCGHRRLVRLAPGYEHPGDPHHPDATHRH